MKEAQLVQGLRDRREEAVAAFLDRFRPLLYHCIGHFETEPGARDDLYQELVLYALERLDADRFDPEKGSLGTWLYRVAWCRCVDVKRKRSSQRATGLGGSNEVVPDRPDPRPSPREQADDSEVGDLVRRALLSLEEDERSLLDLRYVQECTLGEISKRMEISHEQCKYRLKKASISLRKVLLNELSLERMIDAGGYTEKSPSC